MKSELKQILHLLSRAEEPPSLLPAESSIDSDDSSFSSSSSCSSNSTSAGSSAITSSTTSSSTKSIMRRSILIIGSFTYFLFATSRGVVDESSYYLTLSSSMPSLRGGYIMLPVMTSSSSSSSTTTIASTHHEKMMTKPKHRQGDRGQRRMGPLQFGLMVLQRSIHDVGNKLQEVADDAILKQWNGIQDNIGREWFKLISNIEKIFPLQQQQHHHRLSGSSKKLDDVIHAFQSVLNKDSNEVNTAQLLKACRAHLMLMRSGGPALRLVAKDMEANLLKAETLYWNLSKNNRGKDLASLLQTEIENGVHPDVNVLEESSAAMGLLWIRRSLAFQLELYASLSSPSSSSSSSANRGSVGISRRHGGMHPKDAALQAYDKILSPYHGWLLQKVFPLSLSQMPDRQVFLAKFGGREVHELDEEYEQIIEKKLQLLVRTWRPILDVWRREFERLNLEDTRRA